MSVDSVDTCPLNGQDCKELCLWYVQDVGCAVTLLPEILEQLANIRGRLPKP